MIYLLFAVLLVIAYLLAHILLQLRATTRSMMTLYNGYISGTDKPSIRIKGTA
jgi:hypothetical protein